jgi:hypothetical protein
MTAYFFPVLFEQFTAAHVGIFTTYYYKPNTLPTLPPELHKLSEHCNMAEPQLAMASTGVSAGYGLFMSRQGY